MTDDYITANFRVDLGQRIGQAVNVVEIVVGPTGFVGAPEHAIVDYIRSAFADRPKPDLIVTLAGPAAAFARKYRQQLFPDVPLLLASVDQRCLRDTPLGENETAVAVANDFPGVIDLILELLPRTKQVFVVVGSGQSGTFWGREFQTRFTRFQDRLTFIWSGGLSLTETLRQCASLPRDSAILYFTFGTDARGGAYADARVPADLHAAANAPLFGLHSVMLGSGIVGGKLIDIDEVNRSTADAAIRILVGAPPRSVIVPAQPPGHPRLARTTTVGHAREPVAGGRRRALSGSEPVAGTQGHGAQCRRRAGPPITLDRRAFALFDRFSPLDLLRGQIDPHHRVGRAFGSESPRIEAVAASQIQQ